MVLFCNILKIVCITISKHYNFLFSSKWLGLKFKNVFTKKKLMSRLISDKMYLINLDEQDKSLQDTWGQHYENTPMQYTAIFHNRKNDNFQMKNCDIFLTFVQNIACGYSLEAVLTSTHNLCFIAKIRKLYIPPRKPQFYYIKVGCKGEYNTRTCLHDEKAYILDGLKSLRSEYY